MKKLFVYIMLVCLVFPNLLFASTLQRGISIIAKEKASGEDREVKLYRKMHAVIIGIDKYKNLEEDLQLSYAVKDAKGVEAVLSKYYSFDSIHTLYNEQATRENIMEILQGELSGIHEEDAVFIFFSGHGTTQEARITGGKLGYLLPYDGSFDKRKMHKNISMGQLKDDIGKIIPAKHVFYVIDACYSGTLLAQRAGGQNPTHDYEYLIDVTKETVRQALTAGTDNQTVLDGGPNGHSVFTGRLIEKLEATNDYITASELGNYIKRRVASDARARSHTQTPKNGAFYGMGDFVFVPSASKRVIDRSKETEALQEELKRLKALDKKRAEAIRREKEENSKKEEQLALLQREVASRRKKLNINPSDDLKAITLVDFEAQIEDDISRYKRLIKAADAAEKDEFESIAEYRQRVADAAKKKQKLRDELLNLEFKVPENLLLVQLGKYDADRKRFTVDVSVGNKYKTSGYLLNLPSSQAREIKQNQHLITASNSSIKLNSYDLKSKLSLARINYEGKELIFSDAPLGKNWRDPTSGMEFVWIPEGCFAMGNTDYERGRLKDSLPVHEVCLDGFYMGKYEVTNRQYRKFVSRHNSGEVKGYSLDGEEQPVVEVSWGSANGFTLWSSSKSSKFRLPTEAEWEYAARAGSKTSRYWGNDFSMACDYSNVQDSKFKQQWPDWKALNCSDGYTSNFPSRLIQT